MNTRYHVNLQNQESPMSAHLQTRTHWAIALVRIVTGIIFAAHGAQKLFMFGVTGTAGFMTQLGIPFAGVAAPLVIAVELIGGLLLIAGLFTRWVSLPLTATMAVALVTAHLKAGFFLPNGYEFVLLLLATTISLGLSGSGVLALDNVRRRRREDASTALPKAA
jgi:putative oxidoreductase